MTCFRTHFSRYIRGIVICILCLLIVYLCTTENGRGQQNALGGMPKSRNTDPSSVIWLKWPEEETDNSEQDNIVDVNKDGEPDKHDTNEEVAEDISKTSVSSQKTGAGSGIIKQGNGLPVVNKGSLHWTIALRGSYSNDLFSPPLNEIPLKRLPQAIVIGFAKCGTRALIDYLRMHPNIVSAGPEIHFFDDDENFKKGLDWYKDQMPLSYSNQITMEKTPAYIWSERALEEIYRINKNMKLLVIMRDPVSRLVSQSLQSGSDAQSMSMFMKDGHLQIKEQSITVHGGKYVVYLQKWMTKFSKSQIYVLEEKEFVTEPAKELRKLETFLGIPHKITEENFYFNKTKGFYCMRPFPRKLINCLPEEKGTQHPALDPILEKRLYDYYRPYNEQLFRLLGRRFQWEPPSLVTTTASNSFQGRSTGRHVGP